MFDAWLDAARRAGRVLCPSAATADDLCAAGFSADRIRVVPLGADQTLADPGVAAALRDRYRLEGPVVLWLGVVEPRKDLGTLVSALQQVPEATLVVAGPSGWGVDLPAVVGPLGGRVRIVGRVDEAEKRAWYALADVFAYPSLLEGFGLPVLEAMVQGTPIVASSGTATEEVVGPDAVVVGPGDVDAWAAAIHRLLDDPDEARRLGATGRTRAAAHTWEACAAATVDCYREVLQA